MRLQFGYTRGSRGRTRAAPWDAPRDASLGCALGWGILAPNLGSRTLFPFAPYPPHLKFIGGGAVIDRDVSVRRSVVFPDTYLGSGLQLDYKIVSGNRVIDGITGTDWTLPASKAGTVHSEDSTLAVLQDAWRRLLQGFRPATAI